jgi:DNA repair exonuclease SbcCD nuclease subunit
LFLHFSDTHLGYQAFDQVNAAGINAREQDVYDAFERVVDEILAIKPALVVHSGDFFHRPSPSNRALTFGLEQLRRISKAGIPCVILAGNHETPKTVYNSPILRALRTIEHVYPIFEEKWERFDFGQITVHGVPHINDNQLLLQELERLAPVPDKFNILLLHTSLGKKFLMDEYGEQVFPGEFEEKLKQFHYIALGHWHNCQKIEPYPCAWYSGSTERMSDTEIGHEKGFLTVDAAPDGLCSVAFRPIQTRPWLRWEMSNCHQSSVAEIEAALEAFRDSHDCAQAIISLVFNDIRPEQTLDLSNSKLRALFADAFQVVTKRRSFSDRSFVQGIEANQFDSLDKVFADYLRSKFPEDEALAAKLIERAERYFAPKD